MDMRECKAKLIMLGWKTVCPGVLQNKRYSLVFLYNKRISVREYGCEMYISTYDEIIKLELT